MRKLRVLFRGGSNIASLLVVGSNAFLIGMLAFLGAKAGTFSLWTMVVLPLIFAGAGHLLRIVYSRIYLAVSDFQWTRRQARTDDPLAKGEVSFLAGLIDKLLPLALLLLVIAPGVAIYLIARQAPTDLSFSLSLGFPIYLVVHSLVKLYRTFKLLPRPIPLPAGRIPQAGVEIWADQQIWLFDDGSLWKIGPPGQWEQVLGVPPARKLTGGSYSWAVLDHLGQIWICQAEGTPELLSGWRGIGHFAAAHRDLIVATPGNFLFAIEGSQYRQLVRLPKGIASLSAGPGYGAAVEDSYGSVYTWGSNYWGQLGDGSQFDHLEPQVIAGGFQNVICGEYIVIALDQNQRVWVWGNAIVSPATAVAEKKERIILTPRLVPGLEAIVEIALGKNHALALDQQGRVKTWGFSIGSNHALGTGQSEEKLPYPVPLPKPAQHIYAAGQLSLAVLADGSVYGWGMPWPQKAPAILPTQQEIPAIP